MKTFDEIKTKKIPYDGSGIDTPCNWLWALGDKSQQSEAYEHHPKVKIVSKLDLIPPIIDDIFTFEVTCISAINKDTEVADYDTYSFTYNPQEYGEGNAFEWLWNGREDECPPYWEMVEEYIDNEFTLGDLGGSESFFDDTEPHRKYVNDHLINMVAIVDELEGVDLIDLERDMPSLYEQFVKAKAYASHLLKRSSLVLLFPLLFASCQRDTTHTISQTDWKLMEIQNDLEDAKEWLINDIEEGRVDSERGYSYLMILDESIDNLISLPKTK